jgi:hypothetical protein
VPNGFAEKSAALLALRQWKQHFEEEQINASYTDGQHFAKFLKCRLNGNSLGVYFTEHLLSL